MGDTWPEAHAEGNVYRFPHDRQRFSMRDLGGKHQFARARPAPLIGRQHEPRLPGAAGKWLPHTIRSK
jgi:hypothetical protein